MWQTIEHKAAGIEQFRKGGSLQRVIEDVASEAANAAEMKAAATGNPLMLLQVQLNAELKKVEALFSNYKRNQHSLEKRVVWLADTDTRTDHAVSQWNKEITIRDMASTGNFQFQTKTKTYDEKEREALLGDIIFAMKKAVEQRTTSSFSKPNEISVAYTVASRSRFMHITRRSSSH